MSDIIYVDGAGNEVAEGSASSAYIVNKADPNSEKFLERLRAGTPQQTLVTKPKAASETKKTTKGKKG